MLVEEKKLQIFISIYYSCSITLSFLTNLLLLFFMKSTKSALLKDIQYYLFNTTIFELIVSLSTYFAQCRPVANTSTMAVFCFGPCKYFGPNYCFVTFAIVQSSVVAASLSILLSFYYRYRLLVVEVRKEYRHVKTFFIFSIFPIASFIFQMFTNADFDQVEAESKFLHPDYDYVHNSLIGFSNTKSVASITAQITITIGVYISPILAFYYRRKINKILSMNTSQRIPVAYCKQLVNGLFIQTLIPFFVYIPPFSYVLYSMQTGTSNIYLEYLLNIFGSFTAFLNPMLTFYFVLPYRRAFCTKVFRYLPSISEDATENTNHPMTTQMSMRNLPVTTEENNNDNNNKKKKKNSTVVTSLATSNL